MARNTVADRDSVKILEANCNGRCVLLNCSNIFDPCAAYPLHPTRFCITNLNRGLLFFPFNRSSDRCSLGTVRLFRFDLFHSRLIQKKKPALNQLGFGSGRHLNINTQRFDRKLKQTCVFRHKDNMFEKYWKTWLRLSLRTRVQSSYFQLNHRPKVISIIITEIVLYTENRLLFHRGFSS